jgi:hypothetical protein
MTFMAVTVLFLMFAARSWSDMVVGLDLSLSENTHSVTGNVSLNANKIAIHRLIKTLVPGESLYVVGITARSQTDPWIFLSAKMNENPGFFSERSQRDKAIISAYWKKRSQKLKLFAKKTDLLGFMRIAGELFSGTTRQRLHVFSDGKNCTDKLNLEKAPKTATDFMKKLSKIDEFPNLKDVQVYWHGAGGPGTTGIHLKSLEHFWRAFIERSGGKLISFSTLREVNP